MRPKWPAAILSGCFISAGLIVGKALPQSASPAAASGQNPTQQSGKGGSG
jgi:hypothetical protein